MITIFERQAGIYNQKLFVMNGSRESSWEYLINSSDSSSLRFKHNEMIVSKPQTTRSRSLIVNPNNILSLSHMGWISGESQQKSKQPSSFGKEIKSHRINFRTPARVSISFGWWWCKGESSKTRFWREDLKRETRKRSNQTIREKCLIKKEWKQGLKQRLIWSSAIVKMCNRGQILFFFSNHDDIW